MVYAKRSAEAHLLPLMRELASLRCDGRRYIASAFASKHQFNLLTVLFADHEDDGSGIALRTDRR
jgi:hypothetical protein